MTTIDEGVFGPRTRGGESSPQPEGHSVAQFMSRDVLTVPESAQLQHALDSMTRASVRHLIVVAGAADEPIHLRSIVGMFSDRDALDILRREPHQDARLEWNVVRDVMTPAPLITISPAALLSEAAGLMYAERISALPVVDASDELVGVLTTDDLLYAGSVLTQGVAT